MITQISINNFKSFKNINYLNLGSLTVFSGLNGLGKSSMIQALLLLRQSFKDNGFKKGLFLKDAEGIQLGTVRDVFSQDADKTEPMTIDLDIDYENGISMSCEVINSLDKDVFPVYKCYIKKDLSEESLFNKQFQYLSASRIKPEVSYKTSSYYVDELNSLGKEGEFAVHYLALNQDKPLKNKALIHPKSKSDTLIDNVNAWLSEVSPGVKARAQYLADLETAKLSYQFETRDDYTDEFKPTHVGFGLTYVLPIIVALLKADIGSLVILENPESHLHPSGQSKIGHLCALVANSGVQVIIESHSDHIINGIRLAVKHQDIDKDDVCTYFLTRDLTSNSHNSIVNAITIDENGKMSEWPKGFMDEWDKQLDDLLKD